MRFNSLVFLLLAVFCVEGSAQYQLSGYVFDDYKQPLAYATVHESGTTNGVSTNDQGYFLLKVESENLELTVQHIGYETLTKKVDVSMSGEITLTLSSQAVELPSAEVRANAEDPAYAIIRKAIQKRKEHLNWISDFSCESYIKARYQLDSAPEKILGQEVGDLEGRLDSNRQGIVYLSEAISDYYFQAPDRVHEVMKSSKVSGNDQEYSFNRSGVRDAMYYQNTIEFGRPMISPIAANALSYYRYRLEGAFYDKGHLINKIAILPKNETQAVFSGYIYIVEDVWNIHSLDLVTTGDASHITPVDSMWITQIHIPMEEGPWVLLQQNVRFTFSVIGFKGSGEEVGVHNKYNLTPDYPESFNTNQVVLVLDSSNHYKEDYWVDKRPIPLLVQETDNYETQDSMMHVRRSDEYRDSMDRKSNKLSPFVLLMGYDYRNSKNFEYFSFESPLSTVQYNPVQGFNGDLKFVYSKYQKDGISPYTRISPRVNYGFSDKEWRGGLEFTRIFNRHNNFYLYSEIERGLKQYDNAPPISTFLNGVHSLLSHEHLARFYQRTGGRLAVGFYTNNGIFMRQEISYFRRVPLFNTSDFSIINRDDTYAENIPQIGTIGDRPGNIDPHNIVQLTGRIRYKLGEQVVKYPDYTFRRQSRLPTLTFRYRVGLPVLNSDVEFAALSLSLTDRLPVGLAGESRIDLSAGVMLGDDFTTADLFHFNGNELWIANGSIKRGFQALPYYFYSTGEHYFNAHYNHDFNGYLMERIPLMKKLGWTAFAGGSVLKVADLDPYYEVRFGLDRIGWGIFRFFNAGAVLNKVQGQDFKWHFRLGVTLD